MLNMKKISLIVSLAITSTGAFAYDMAEGCTVNNALTDKNVFNWRYYLNVNADLLQGGINTPTAACTHWVNQGINENRQGHAGFHASQYLERYPDLLSAFGSGNFSAAINHYVNNGIAEYRTGYLDNGISQNKQTTTISNSYENSKIFIGTTKRSSGAIDSLIFDNIEFINAYDHGRQLQLASVSSWGEGYNPTEAGSCNNGVGYATSSILNTISTSGHQLSTSVTPSFWRAAGQTPECGLGQNSVNTAFNHRFHKRVTIGTSNTLPNVIEFSTQIDINEFVPQNPNYPWGPMMRFEIPTGYMSGEFNRFFRYNRSSNSTYEVTGDSCLTESNGCVNNDPIIYATNNLSHAMAACTGGASGANFSNDPKYQAYGILDSRNPAASTSKWAIFRYIQSDVYPGTTLNFNSYISVEKTSNGINSVEKSKQVLKKLFDQSYCFE